MTTPPASSSQPTASSTTQAAPSTLRRVVQLSVSLVVGAVCLWFAFRGLDGAELSLDDVKARVAAVPAVATAGFFVLFLGQVLLRTERWRLQVRGLSGHTPGWRDALAINAFAFAAVFLLPFRLGEFVRPKLSQQRGLMSVSAGLAASAVERVVDGLLTTALFGALLLLSPHDLPAPVRVGGLSALGIFGGAVVFFVVAFRFRALALGLIDKTVGVVHAGLAQRLRGIAGDFLDGLACFGGVGGVGVYVGLSVAYWMLNALSMLLIVRAVDATAPIDAGFFCLCFLVIGVMIPAPPGNVGNFHYFARAGLMLTGVAAAPAVATAIVLHALTVVGVVVWAGFFFFVGGFSWRELSRPSA